jgi:single-strand DNA-binding protein
MSAPIVLTGRMAAEPVLQFSASGKAIARFTIVTSGRKKDQVTGDWSDVDTSWWRCTAFDQLAEAICETMEKGAAVIASGTASQDDWTDKDGNTRTSLKCVVNNMGPDLRWAKRKETSHVGNGGYEESPPF